VKYKLPWYVSTAHLLVAMSYFATLIYTAFLTRPAPSVLELETHERQRNELGKSARWILIAVGAVFVQLLLGALVRHLGAAMVCLGMPTCTIASIAPTGGVGVGPGEWWPDAPVQQLHMIHRGFGVVVGIVTTIAAVQVYRAAKSWPAMRLLALIAPLLVGAQILLGIYTVMTMRSVPLAVGHFAGACALWALWMSAALMLRGRSPMPVAKMLPRRSLGRVGDAPSVVEGE
jgi:heme A synthase